MNSNKFRLLSVRAMLLAGAAVALPAAVHAQGVQAIASGAAEAATSSTAVQEVVVTARRRAERLIDVPVAVTAIDTKALQRYSTNSLEQVGTQIPQVMFSKTASGVGASINIRGVGTNTSADDGVDQAVSVNIDGVPTARGRILATGLFDIDEVQVLKGPQALYFGKNSPGGSLIIDTKGPTSTREGYVQLGYETTAHEYRADAAVGGPINDAWGFRIAVHAMDMTQGYVRNIAQPISAAADPIAYDQAHGLSIPGGAYEWGPEAKLYAGRLTLRYAPSTSFDATLKAMASTYRDNGDSSQSVVASCVPGETHTRTTDLSAVFTVGHPNSLVDPNSYCGADKRVNDIGQMPAPIAAGMPFNSGHGAQYGHAVNYLSSLTMNWHMDNMTVTSVTGLYKFNSYQTNFSDITELSLAGGVNNSFNTSWTQEFRLVTAFDGPLNFTGGLFYGNDKRENRVASYIVRYINPATGNSATVSGLSNTSSRSLAAYGELTWKIAPTLELAGGARYTRDTKNGTLTNDYSSPVAAILHLGAPAGLVAHPHLSDTNTSPQVTLTWHNTPNSSFYAGYRTGYKSGAISNPGLIGANIMANPQIAVLKPEIAKGEEAGYKFQSDDHRFSGDLAIYNYKYSNLQVSAFSSAANTVITANAGDANVRGVEASLRYQVSDDLNLHAAGGYNDAKYGTFTNAQCWGGQTALQGCVGGVQNLSGVTLPRAPKVSGTIGFSYDHPVSENLMVGVAVDARYTSKYEFVTTNNPFSIQKGFGTIDASARLYAPDNHWELAVIGRNLTNEFYFTIGSERPFGASPGSTSGVAGAPRTVVLQATYRY